MAAMLRESAIACQRGGTGTLALPPSPPHPLPCIINNIRNAERSRWKEATMAVYIMFTTLTDEGRKTLKDNPKRLREVNKEVEAMGVKILAQYAVLGQYDFINILEAAGNTTISKLALELGSRGTMQTMTMAAIPID